MRRLLHALALVAVCSTLGVAQEKADGESAATGPAQAIAPFVDNQTLAIVRVDLAAFDASETVELLAVFLQMTDAQRDQAAALVAPIRVFSNALPAGGQADIFTVVSFSDLASVPFFFVLPLETNPAAAAIGMEIRRGIAEQAHTEAAMERLGDVIVTGSARTVERLKKAKPVAREDISQAFEAVEESPLQVLLVPTAAVRRLLQVTVPSLPAELGGGPTKPLTESIEWVAFGLHLPPSDTDARFVVQATSDEAAAVLAIGIAQQIEALGQRDDVRQAIPEFDDLATRLQPQIAGRRVTVEFTASPEEVASLGAFLAPLLKQAQGTLAQQRAR